MFMRFFSRQARKPSGWLGSFIAKRVFDRGNCALNTLMTEMVDPREHEVILEIGFGCGTVIRALADRLGDGRVEGIDFSDSMLAEAHKRNQHHIRDGRVRLVHGDFDSARYSDGSFHTVCSANTIYFWPDLARTCARIHAILKPGGKVVLAFVEKRKMDTKPLDMSVFRSVSSETVQGLLGEAGFTSIQVQETDVSKDMVCVLGVK